jgi:hypothetical protein
MKDEMINLQIGAFQHLEGPRQSPPFSNGTPLALQSVSREFDSSWSLHIDNCLSELFELYVFFARGRFAVPQMPTPRPLE